MVLEDSMVTEEPMAYIETIYLIYLLRIAGKAVAQPNRGTNGLGREIAGLILFDLGGEILDGRAIADWTKFVGLNMPINNYSLPSSSHRFLVPISQLQRLLAWINRHV